MTIVEVIISFVILVVISAMVLSVSMNYLKQFKTVRQNITEKGFGYRGDAEEQMEKIANLISVRNEKGDIISSAEQRINYIALELANSTGDKKKLEDEKKSLEKLKEESEKEQKNTEKELESYLDKENDWDTCQLVFNSIKISKKKDKNFVYVASSKTGVDPSVKGWIFGNYINLKIPILKEVVRYFNSDTSENREQQVVGYVTGRTLYAKSEYLSGFDNPDNLEQVVWYQSRPGYHIYPLTWDMTEWNNQDFYPAFPMDYVYIPKKGVSGPGYTEKHITIDRSMEGSFVVCGIRPYTKQGILGRLVGSMPIYISKLPFDKQNCLFREDISIINPNKLIDRYPPDNEGNIKVKELYAWNNEESSSQQSMFRVPADKEGVAYFLQPEQTGIIKEGGTNFETKSRYLAFSGDSVGVIPSFQTDKFSLFAVFGYGSTVNHEGNIMSIPFLRDKAVAIEVSASGKEEKTEADRVAVLAKIGFEKIELIQPEQIALSRWTQKQCKVEEEILATIDISDIMKQKIEFGKKAGIFTVVRNGDHLEFGLNGESLGSFDVSEKNLYNDNQAPSAYLGSLIQTDDIKLSKEAVKKEEYKSAEVHIYEMLALNEREKVNDMIDALKKKYGIE